MQVFPPWIPLNHYFDVAAVPAPKGVFWFSFTRVGLRTLGRGPITGAADDDPSGIATYSQVVRSLANPRSDLSEPKVGAILE